MGKQRETTQVSDPLRRLMHSRGWLTVKTTGGRFSSGWPDLFCAHPEYGMKWVETKVPGGRLRPSQRKMFTKLAKHGVKIWVIIEPDGYYKLFNEPNWWKYV